MSTRSRDFPESLDTAAVVTLADGVNRIFEIHYSYDVEDVNGGVIVTHDGEEVEKFSILKGDQGSRQYSHGWVVGNGVIVIKLIKVTGAKGRLTVMAI